MGPTLYYPLGLIYLSLILLNLPLLANFSVFVHLKLDPYGPWRHRGHDQIIEDGVPVDIPKEDFFPETFIPEETLAHPLPMHDGLVLLF